MATNAICWQEVLLFIRCVLQSEILQVEDFYVEEVLYNSGELFILKEFQTKREVIIRVVKRTPVCPLYKFTSFQHFAPFALSFIYFSFSLTHIHAIFLKYLRLVCMPHILLPLNTSTLFLKNKFILLYNHNIVIKFRKLIQYFDLQSVFRFCELSQ